MLRTTKNMKEKYEQIQNYLYTLIPEKWEGIYLYASVGDEKNNKSGELFFYYLPKGILKKRPINVYEVPQRFNINEEQYLGIVEDLYKCIKSLRQDFEDTDQELWTNLNISIENFKFKVEYKYDVLPVTEEEIKTRNIIWMYKYLKIGGETKEEQKILEEYYTNLKPTKRELYETGLYLKTENNTVTFDKEENNQNASEFIIYEKDEIANMIGKIKNRQQHNKIETEERKDSDKEEKKRSKNQILNS